MAVELATATIPTAARSRRRFAGALDTRTASIVAPIAFLVLVVLGWQLICSISGISALVLPAPSDVVAALVQEWGSISEAALRTITEMLIAVAIATVVGVVLGFGVAQSEAVHATIYPFLVAIQSAPKIAIAPIALLWFGTGMGTPVLMGFIMAVFPIVVATEAGFRSVHPELHELATSLRASWGKRFRKISLPSALPSMMSGFRIAVAQSITGIIVAEFVQESGGLGFVIVNAASHGQSSVAFAVLVVLAAIALVAIGLVGLAERAGSRWMRGYSNS
jgi:NitT/TauT family transport system permease protein